MRIKNELKIDWVSTSISIMFCLKFYRHQNYSIGNLEAENQNMNSRVQQLYMQLLHEIVKKKDIELDSKTVEKKLLNQTVHLYELEVTLWKLVRPNFDLVLTF